MSRKYYRPESMIKRQFNHVNERYNVCPFALLETYLHGLDAAYVSEPIRQRFAEICKTKDVQGYLTAVSEMEEPLKFYGSEIPHQRVYAERQLCSLLKKYPFTNVESGLDPRAVAIAKWRAAEDQCLATNIRLRGITSNEEPSFVPIARRLIAEVLGTLDASLTMKMVKEGEHGPGQVLTSLDTARTTLYYKYNSSEPSVTSGAKLLGYAAISTDTHWLNALENLELRKTIPHPMASRAEKEQSFFDDCVAITDYERLSFVPKDARTERPIGIGASLNMYLQLGVKAYITKQLKKVAGIDLEDQTKNQRMARLGSLHAFLPDGTDNPYQYSTIDLAAASDTISDGIVQKLLPARWYNHLNRLRHKGAVLPDGTIHMYEKFSAMGNGFTFPLESLIFWAIAKASALDIGSRTNSNDISVFGDDIICRYEVAETLITNLNWCGFTVNSEKSFLTGHFKESCGADYFQGHNVRPFYIKRRITHARDIYFCANRLSANASNSIRGNVGAYCNLYAYLVGQIPIANIIYCSMSSIFSTTKLGLVQGDNEDGLCVPLSFLSSIGLRPYLSNSEKRGLLSAGLIAETRTYKFDFNTNLPIEQSVSSVCRFFDKKTASEVVKYCMFLNGTRGQEQRRSSMTYSTAIDEGCLKDVLLKPFWMSDEDFKHIRAAKKAQITRRGKMRTINSCKQVPTWDSVLTATSLTAHPIHWVKRLSKVK